MAAARDAIGGDARAERARRRDEVRAEAMLRNVRDVNGLQGLGNLAQAEARSPVARDRVAAVKNARKVVQQAEILAEDAENPARAAQIRDYAAKAQKAVLAQVAAGAAAAADDSAADVALAREMGRYLGVGSEVILNAALKAAVDMVYAESLGQRTLAVAEKIGALGVKEYNSLRTYPKEAAKAARDRRAADVAARAGPKKPKAPKPVSKPGNPVPDEVHNCPQLSAKAVYLGSNELKNPIRGRYRKGLDGHMYRAEHFDIKTAGETTKEYRWVRVTRVLPSRLSDMPVIPKSKFDDEAQKMIAAQKAERRAKRVVPADKESEAYLNANFPGRAATYRNLLQRRKEYRQAENAAGLADVNKTLYEAFNIPSGDAVDDKGRPLYKADGTRQTAFGKALSDLYQLRHDTGKCHQLNGTIRLDGVGRPMLSTGKKCTKDFGAPQADEKGRVIEKHYNKLTRRYNKYMKNAEGELMPLRQSVADARPGRVWNGKRWVTIRRIGTELVQVTSKGSRKAPAAA